MGCYKPGKTGVLFKKIREIQIFNFFPLKIEEKTEFDCNTEMNEMQNFADWDNILTKKWK